MRSAFSMTSVLALGMSIPVSMMVVEIRMSTSPTSSFCQMSEISSLSILPCAIAIEASGASWETRAAHESMSSTRLCSQKI